MPSVSRRRRGTRRRRVSGIASCLGLVLAGACADPLAPPAESTSTTATAALRQGNERFDWDRIGAPEARADGAMVFDSARQRLVSFGGRNGGTLVYRDVWERRGGHWTERTELDEGPVGRSDFGLAYDSQRQRTVAFGGLNARRDTLRELWEWDGTVWTARTSEQSGPSARAHVAMAYDRARGTIVVFGGAPTGSNGTRELWEWDGATWTDRTAPEGVGPGARRDASMIYDAARSRIVLFGGRLDTLASNDVWEWDGTSWQPAPAGPSARYDASFGYDEARQRAVLFGGTNGTTSVADVWEYDGVAWTERTPSVGGPSPREGALAAYDGATARFVVQGGGITRDGAPVNAQDAWAWDGTAWTELPTRAVGPSFRNYPVGAYDSVRARGVLFGGLSVTDAQTVVTFDDTWEWDGEGWLERAPTTRPPPRYFASLVYDAARRVTVLFGGGNTTDGVTFTRYGDTWTWDGTNWTEHAVPGPSPRLAAAMAYDESRARVVAFGGTSANEQNGDLWEWDGAAWEQRTQAGDVPGNRALTTMAFDASLGRIVLYGGLDATSYGTDLRTWDGAQWTLVTPADATRPTAIGGALVRDRARGSLLLVSAPDPSAFGAPMQLWEWSSSRWSRLPLGRTPEGLRDHALFPFEAKGQIVAYGGAGPVQLSNHTSVLFGRGAPCTSSADAATGFCVDGVACESAACAACETCAAPDDAGRCTPVRSAEDPDTCGGERRSACDASGRCRLVLGAAAVDGAACVSGFVADGVCCEVASCGACRTCSAAEKEIPDNDGRCGTRRAGTDPGNDCAEEPVAGCGLDGTCDGRGACRSYVAGTACGPVLRDAERVSSSVCTGAGACTVVEASCDGQHSLIVPGAEPVDCGAFGCEGPICKTSCASVADCANGFECNDARACVPRAEAPAADGGCTCDTSAGADPRDLASTLGLIAVASWLVRRRRAGRGSVATASALGLVGLTGCEPGAPRESPSSVHETSAALTPTESVAWTRIGTPPARYEAGLVYDTTRQRVLSFGGHTGLGLAAVSYRDLWELDGMAWVERTPLATGPVARYGSAVVYDRSRRNMLVFGGVDVNGLTSLGDQWTWNGSTWTQVFVEGAKPAPRHLAASCFDETRQRVVLFGGARGNSFLNETWEWDGTAWTPKVVEPAPAARIGASLVFDVARAVSVLVGGQGVGSTYLRETWEWDGQSWADRTPPAGQGPSARGFSGATYDRGRSRLVLAAGTSGTVSREVWERDPQGTWAQRTPPSDGPTSRMAPGLVYDERRQRSVLFGGFRDGIPRGDTWEWDGTTWTARAEAPQPDARIGHFSAYDAVSQRVAMFGGRSGTTDRNQLWLWDGAAWTERTVAGAPVARSYPVMASSAERTVVFGGRIDQTTLRETWTWDGSAWHDLTPAEGGPEARWLTAMTYDAGRSRWVLFGGRGAAGQELADTWELDGTTWTQRTPAHSPSARRLHNMSYDPVRQRVVLFGGAAAAYNRELWEWDGTDWVDRTVSAGGPGPYAYVQSVYDASRKAVLFVIGPGTSFGERNEIWAWDGAWTRLPTAARPASEIEYSVAYDPVRARTVFAGNGATGFETWELVGRGAPCTDGLDSTTGFCVDGVSCLTSECPGSCQACNVPGSEGTCTTVVLAADPDTCSDGRICDRAGVCRAALGRPATAGTDCASGFVVDGVCCETSECGPCSTCTAAQKEIADNDGRCGTQRAGLDLHDECTSTPAETCGADGVCDGRGACRLHARGTVCAAGSSCSGAGVCAADNAGCDGDGAVRAVNGERTDCGGFRCVDAACLTSCQSLADCTVGSVCDASHRCIPESTEQGSDSGCACESVGSVAPRTWPLAVGAFVLALARRARDRRRSVSRS